MGELICLEDYRTPWHEVITVDGPGSTLQVFKNVKTGEVELVQLNGEGEAIVTVVPPLAAAALGRALASPAQTGRCEGA